jgi:hypothetical protein
VSVTFLLFPPILIIGKSDQSVLKLDAGGGVNATLSNYSLTNYSYSTGGYQGTFCFTVANTSKRPDGSLPVFLVGVGLVGHSYSPRYRLLSHSIEGPFSELFDPQFPGGNVGPTDFDILLTAGDWARSSFKADSTLLDGPTDGIPENNDATFCMFLDSATPFTVYDLVSSLGVVFDDFVQACYSPEPNSTTVRPYALIRVQSFSNKQITFVVNNQPAQRNTVNSAITGFGFAVPGKHRRYLLLTVPQNFDFTQNPRRLRLPDEISTGNLDFGLLTGFDFDQGLPQLGILPFSLQAFQIGGDFEALKTSDILTGAIVRFETSWATLDYGCPDNPTAGGLRGVVATNPQ